MIFFIRLFLIGFLCGTNPDTLSKTSVVNPFEQKEPEYIPAPDFKLNSISVIRDSSLNNLYSFIDTSSPAITFPWCKSFV